MQGRVKSIREIYIVKLIKLLGLTLEEKAKYNRRLEKRLNEHTERLGWQGMGTEDIYLL